ncbi:glutamyl-Q-tRNA synthetase [Rhodovulum sp. PH10]|uniref:tRNA glutamyl-Q(34) synthetase GluQRS n=1 Tax=Rhodovulum sp. PH10 TaxID=1187851 RepID=UPI00027C2ED3|nr:tRNA glutamyl-Q(34) synthetase GluQRS [Rhodovulum sp. PH10]EJW09832.1 glutamyl-Q-tRNA synthetase [Rhodovulum sp. PH10]
MAGVFRFAPSPNGLLHLGHALSALLNADLAERSCGRLLLRIEDIDRTRCRPELEAAIFSDLGWLGTAWETPVRRQSEHFSDYRQALQKLDAMGLVYPSFESRAEIARLVFARDTEGDWPRDPDGTPLYPGDAKSLSRAEREARIASGAPYALRLDMAAALARLGETGKTLSWRERGEAEDDTVSEVPANPAAWGDVVLARKDVPTSYHLAVVVDDAAQGVTEVVRGRDLFHATSVHRLLQALLGLPAPNYRHHRLISDADGKKLSKSTGATALRALREAGATPADIRRRVGLGDGS